MVHSATINKSCQAPKISSNDLNHLRPPPHRTTTTRALVSLAAVLLVVASAGFGMLFAGRSAASTTQCLACSPSRWLSA